MSQTGPCRCCGDHGDSPHEDGPVARYLTCEACGAHPLQVRSSWNGEQIVYPCVDCGHVPESEIDQARRLHPSTFEPETGDPF